MSIERILTATLAGSDALFIPNRDPSARHSGPLRNARQLYLERGLAWRSEIISSKSVLDRKRAEKTLDKAITDDLMTSFGSAGRRENIKLTDTGEAIARRLVDLADFESSEQLLLDVQQAISKGNFATYIGKQWVPEWHLAGFRDYQDGDEDEIKQAIMEVEDRALPLLNRGAIRYGASSHRAVWYRLCDVSFSPEVDHEHAEQFTFNPEMRKFYYQRLRVEQAQLRQADTCTEIGQLPVPASMAIGNHFSTPGVK